MANVRLQDSLPGHFQRAQDELLSGDLKKAISSFKGLIRDWSIHQGVDGESTQACRYCLGESLIKDEQWNEAELVLAALLVDRVRLLGPEDLLSITTRRLYAVAAAHGRPSKFVSESIDSATSSASSSDTTQSIDIHLIQLNRSRFIAVGTDIADQRVVELCGTKALRVRATNPAEKIREALSDENFFIREVSVYKTPDVAESSPIEQTQDDAESSLSTPDQIPQANWWRRFLAARLRASAVRMRSRRDRKAQKRS